MVLLTEMQERCVETVVSLLRQGRRGVTIAGYAGTGKTTIAKFIVQALGVENNTAYCTFTGKASLVLRSKGLPATTIHKLIYDCQVDDFGEIIVSLKQSLSKSIKLIVVDEVSMVSNQLLTDLLTFNIPILAIGDHGQLPPIGEDNGLLHNPDFVLTEIHRQAADNPIIYLSKLIRENKFERMNNDKVKTLKRTEFDFSMMEWADQTLCGFNATRKFLNEKYRKIYFNTEEKLPIVGEKIISLRNCWRTFDTADNPLMNGTVCTVEKAHKQKFTFKASLFDADNNSHYQNLAINTQVFENKPISLRNRMPVFDFGYSITVHRAQGSEYDKLLLIDERLNKENYNKWFYTAVTRAKNKLVIIKD